MNDTDGVKKKAYIEENCVAIIGTEDTEVRYFTTLNAAVNEAQTNETITLLKDVELNDTITLNENKSITLNLDNYTLTHDDSEDFGAEFDSIINIEDGTLTIKGSENGTIKSTITGNLINVEGIAGNPKLILESGTLELSSKTSEDDEDSDGPYYVVYVDNGGVAEIKGGTIKGTGDQLYGIYNGEGATTTIKGGKINITGKEYADMEENDASAGIKNSDGGTVTISGTAEITVTGKNTMGVYNTGTSAEEDSASKVNIEGGTIKASGEGSTGIYNDSSTAEGGDSCTVNISGGTVEGEKSAIVNKRDESEEESKSGSVNISGGTIIGDIVENKSEGEESGITVTNTNPVYFDKAENVPAGYGYKEVTVDGKTRYQIVDVAQIGGTKYATLAAAFKAANDTNEPTIKLLADVNIDTAIEINKTTGIYLHLNFDGHTINSSVANTFTVKKGRFWIQNTNTTTGGITQTASGAVIKVESDNTNEASFKMRTSTGSYTIKNTANDNSGYVIDVSGSNASAIIEAGKIESTYGGLKVSNSATATVTGDGTSITATGSDNTVGVFVDDSSTLTFGKTDKSDAPTITATSTGADTKSVGILQAGGTLTVNSGTITGGNSSTAGTGVEVHAGTFNFNGGTITGYGDKFTDTAVTDGDTETYPLTSGAGIAISQLEASKTLTFNAAKGTTASGFVALAVTNPNNLTDSSTVPSVMVSGGTFTSTSSETATWTDNTFSGGKYAFLNKDTRVTVNLAKSIITGKDGETDKTIDRNRDVFPAEGDSGWSGYPSNKAFTIPTIRYTDTEGKETYSEETLAEAVNKAQAGTTIYLYANQSGNGFTIDKNLTINFGGYTYTITAPTDENAENLTHIVVGTSAEVTIQNGTIDAASGSKLSTLIESKKTLTLSKVTLDGANLTGDNAYAVTNNYRVTFNSGTVINPLAEGKTNSKVGSIKIDSRANNFTWTRESGVEINGNVLVSGNQANWGGFRIKISPQVNGDILLDETAAKSQALTNVSLETMMNAAASGAQMFSDNTFILGNGTDTFYPNTNLIAYKLNSNDSLYHVGANDGWFQDDDNNWVHIAPSTTGYKISDAVTKFSGLSTVAQGTSVALDTVNSVAGISAIISLSADVTTPTATVGSASYAVAQMLFDSGSASFMTFVDGVTITEALYGLDVTKVTAAGNSYGIDIAGNSKVTEIIGTDYNDNITSGSISALLNGGGGSDTYLLTSNGATVDTSLGDDTISVDSGITSFSVSGFSAGDVIKFANDLSVTSLANVDGNLVANLSDSSSVTISGLSLSIIGDWTLDAGAASYAKTTLAGALLSADGLSIGYRDYGKADTIIELSGISTTDGLIVNDAGSSVSLGVKNFLASGVSILSNSAGYSFFLTADNYNNWTFTGTNLADTISVASGASYLNVNAGGGSDIITTYGDNILINGGADNDSINLAGGTGATVDVSKGDDTITVASGVTVFSVSGFSVGDVIQ